MQIVEAAISGVRIVRPVPIVDDRGFFVRTSDSEIMRAGGIETTSFVQENQSRTRRGTIRGLHFRADLNEAKLVRCARGRLRECIVDLRPHSATYLVTMSLTLDDLDCVQVFVPGGCAHGFTPLTEEIDVCYRHTARYEPALERAVRFDDPSFGFDWGVADPVLSERDRTAPSFSEIENELAGWFVAVNMPSAGL